MTTQVDLQKVAGMDDEDFCWMFESMLLQDGWRPKGWTPNQGTHVSEYQDDTMNIEPAESLESDDSRSSDDSSPLSVSSPTPTPPTNIPNPIINAHSPPVSAPGPFATQAYADSDHPPQQPHQEPHIPGCPLLRSLLTYALSSDADSSASALQTTGGAYLDIILAHRDAFSAFPQGHASCALAFSDLARALELRAWSECGPAGDGDMEAVVVFRQEAWLCANYFTRFG